MCLLLRSDELRLDYFLQPGDIQLLNNHTCLHTRGAFVDFPVRPQALALKYCMGPVSHTLLH